jgi:hypothetical protein
MNNVSVQSLNECFNVSGEDFIAWDDNYDTFQEPLRGESHIRYGTKWTVEERESQKNNPFFRRENQVVAGRKGGKTTKDKKLGIFDPEYDRIPDAIKGGQTGAGGRAVKERNIGIFDPRNKDKCRDGRLKIHKQMYKCLITGYISNACGLSNYQKGKGIDFRDKSLRVKVSNLESVPIV